MTQEPRPSQPSGQALGPRSHYNLALNCLLCVRGLRGQMHSISYLSTGALSTALHAGNTHTTAGAATRHRARNWVILARDKDSGADSRSWNLAKRHWQCHIMNSRALGGVITIPVTALWKKKCYSNHVNRNLLLKLSLYAERSRFLFHIELSTANHLFCAFVWENLWLIHSWSWLKLHMRSQKIAGFNCMHMILSGRLINAVEIVR